MQELKYTSVIEYLRRTSYLWRCAFIGDRYSDILKESVIDVGCFIGLMSFCTGSKIYLGIDHSKDSIRQASSLNKGAHFIIGNAPIMSIRDCTFNAVIASELIEYLEDPEEFFREVRRILCDGGYLILVANNAYSLIPLIRKLRGWRGVKHIFVPSEILWLLKKHGFKLEEFKGLQLFEYALNFVKIILVKSAFRALMFEEIFFNLRTVDSKLAQMVGILAPKHIYVAEKVS